MDDIKNIYSKLEDQEKRIKELENTLNISHYDSDISDSAKLEENVKHHKSHMKSKPILPEFTFNQVITFLGILGVIIGLISFFFYAVANHWIGESLQILIGILVGAILFGFAYKLHEKNLVWSLFVFGGSMLVEFITIGVGVLGYEVLPKVLGFFILLIFVCVSVALSLKFNSRIIAYYCLVGGYLVPILSGLYTNKIFIISYLLLLSLGLLVLSSKNNWADLRLVTGIVQLMYISSNMRLLTDNNYLAYSLTFVILNFLIYNVATMLYSVRNKKEINVLDAITMNFNSIFFLIISYVILEDVISRTEFGIFVLPVAFLYLVEMYYLMQSTHKDYKATYYSIFSSAIITLNLAIYFILNMFDVDFFVVIFAIEWFMFSLMSKSSEDRNYFNVISHIFLGLFALWYVYVINFHNGMLHATIYMLFYIIVIGLIAILLKKDVNRKINGVLLLLYIFVVIFSLSKYLWFFKFNGTMMSLSLSVMWLIYTLLGIKLLSKEKEARIIMMVLLGITVLKIAFVDLLYLSGVYRIIGFTIFGILLLIGGYFLKNDANN